MLCDFHHYRCKLTPTTENECRELLVDNYYVVQNLIFIPGVLTELQVIVETLQGSERCSLFIRIAFCFYNFPPCNLNTSEAIPICPDKCSEFESVTKECRGIIDLPTFQLLPVLGDYLDTFNCSNPRTYYPHIPSNISISTTICSKSTCMACIDFFKSICIVKVIT